MVSGLRDLDDLVSEAGGRALLREGGMYTDPAEFIAALRTPPAGPLTALGGLPAMTPLVYIGQQVCADYETAVVAKFQVAHLLRSRHVAPVLVWHDLDRAGSERFGMRILLPTGEGHNRRGSWLADRSLSDREIRFVPVDRDRLRGVFADLGRWVDHRRRADGGDARARVSALAAAVLSSPVETLASANRALAEHLLLVHLALEVPSVLASALLQPALAESVDTYLAVLDDVVRVFNEAVDKLRALGIDPCVHQLGDDYLPLFFSCRHCNLRVRLRHGRDGVDHFAAAACRCGVVHRFHLGTVTLSLGELEATDRWSPDVSLLLHVNRLASGSVVGRSTALYGMVLNEVMERALGFRPVPGLVPPRLTSPDNGDDDGTTLLAEYLGA